MGRRFTWVIVASVGALLLFAGLDALRSSAGSEDSTLATSTRMATTASDSSGSLLPCAVEDLRISIDLRGGGPTLVTRNFGRRATGYSADGTCGSRIERATRSRSGTRSSSWPTACSRRARRARCCSLGPESCASRAAPTSYASRSAPTSPAAVTSRAVRLAASGPTQRGRGKKSSASATVGRGSSLPSVAGPASIKLAPL
jgi:hypothetical protein